MLFLALLIVSAFSQPSDPVLLSSRMDCLQLLVNRANSYPQLLLAYANCTADDATHTVRDVGDFGPGRELALEYDEIVNIFPLIGIPSPVILSPKFDPSTVTWLSADTVRVEYTINITLSFNASTGGYDYVMQGFRYSTFFVYSNSTTDRVSLMYDIQDQAAIALFSLSRTSIPASIICSEFIFPACAGHLQDTSYSTVEECSAFIASVQRPSVCPFQGRSNTADCRTTHAWAAFIRPDIHCSHVSRVNPVCSDSCFPACDSCDVNAECVASFPTLFNPGYTCQCRNGYVGDGLSCTAQPCSSRGLCSSREKVCDSGLCKCRDTYTWNATTGECECLDGRIWNGVCVPTGRCTEKKHCAIQDSRTVTCSTYGYNPLTDWKHCLCNYGFEGGWEYACTCPAGRREVHSGQPGGGRVCISATECVRRHDCGRHQSCQLRSDGTGIGDCI